MLAGLFSKIFNEDIDCVEVDCAALSGDKCKFIIKPKTEFDFSNLIVQQQLSHE
jgi:predicted hydrocarbon binding protein